MCQSIETTLFSLKRKIFSTRFNAGKAANFLPAQGMVALFSEERKVGWVPPPPRPFRRHVPSWERDGSG